MPNQAASPNRRQRIAFAMHLRFDYYFCAQPSLSAAAGEPQRYCCFRYMKTPQELHDWVCSYNWDDGLAPIWPVVQSDTTELATALLIYWRLEGPWFQAGADANEEAERLHALVERRLLEGVYAKGSVRYDPVADNGLSKVQISKLKQSGLPIQFLEPVYGS